MLLVLALLVIVFAVNQPAFLNIDNLFSILQAVSIVALLGIGVTVLCPGFVRTRIWQSGRNRPERYGPTRTLDPASPAGRFAAQLAELGRSGLHPTDVAAQVLTAIREDELYVFTHFDADWRAELAERFATILAAMDKAAVRSASDASTDLDG